MLNHIVYYVILTLHSNSTNTSHNVYQHRTTYHTLFGPFCYRFHRPQSRRSADPDQSGIFRTVAMLRIQIGNGPLADLLRRHVHHSTATGTYLRCMIVFQLK